MRRWQSLASEESVMRSSHIKSFISLGCLLCLDGCFYDRLEVDSTLDATGGRPGKSSGGAGGSASNTANVSGQFSGGATAGGSGGGATQASGGAVQSGGSSQALGGEASFAGGAPPDPNGGTGELGGSAEAGGTTSGGMPGSGGSIATAGATAAGGTVGGNNTGGSAAGGASKGGAAPVGGSNAGGASTGGAATIGGANAGGVSTGGATPNGGANTGGVSKGGATSIGGANTGGVSTGGVSTGGVSTGGVSPTGGAGPVCSGSPTLGCPCTASGTLACNGAASKLVLICSAGTWSYQTTCDANSNCNQASGVCQAIIPQCTAAGVAYCEGVDVRRVCGADLVTSTTQTCTGVCSAGACVTPRCGDGKIETGEECDDGNTQAADGCEPAPAACQKSKILSMALGNGHMCALLLGGNVRCWGNNIYNQLGLGHAEDVSALHPYQIPLVDLGGQATAIAGSSNHTCALLADKTIRCWGNNDSGQLGLGNINQVLDKTPNNIGAIQVGGNAIAVAANGAISCAVLETGSVRCWGSNVLGRLGLGNTTAQNLSLPKDFGPVALGNTATAVALGSGHTCALLTGGSVRCWGSNASGQLGLSHTNTIGDNEPPYPNATNGAGLVPLPAGRTAKALSIGGSSTCVRLDDGEAECWGYNGNGQLGIGSTSAIGDGESPAVYGLTVTGGAVSSIVMGSSHACDLMADGPRCWGSYSKGEHGLGDRIARGDLATNTPTPAHQSAVTFTDATVQAVYVGTNATCALLSDGQLRCWGWNDRGQLGLAYISSAPIDYVGGDSSHTPNLIPSVRVFQ